VRESSIEL